jgi:hypothetical protein
VWRIEEVENEINSFGQSAQFWRGGYNCRHEWYRIFYKRSADIINKASVNKGKITDGTEGDFPIELGTEWLQPDTVTDKTAANPSPSTIRNLGLSKEQMGYDNILPPYVDQVSGDTISKSLLGSIIICKDCGWEWEIKEGGKDPYICNKCGCNNSIESEKMSKQYFATDSEKHIVLGPAMIPDQKIFRKDALGNPYYVYFSPDTIKMIAEKYMRNKYTDNNDTMHDGKAIKDIHVVESWIKDSEHDKSNAYGFEDLPIGTWFVSMKVNNPLVWEQVKKGKLNGFSVSGYFEEVAQFSKEEMFLYKVAELLKNVKD